MISAIRTTARTVSTILDFCLSPACLHSGPAKGCSCCQRGHSRKGQTRQTKKHR